MEEIVVVPFGLVVRIPGFHPGGPGSIPGVGVFVVAKLFFPLPVFCVARYVFALFCKPARKHLMIMYMHIHVDVYICDEDSIIFS